MKCKYSYNKKTNNHNLKLVIDDNEWINNKKLLNETELAIFERLLKSSTNSDKVAAFLIITKCIEENKS